MPQRVEVVFSAQWAFSIFELKISTTRPPSPTLVSDDWYCETSSENPVICRVSQKLHHTRCCNMSRASGDLCANRYRQNAPYDNDLCSASCCQNVRQMSTLYFLSEGKMAEAWSWLLSSIKCRVTERMELSHSRSVFIMFVKCHSTDNCYQLSYLS
jgi:hypothetical protein